MAVRRSARGAFYASTSARARKSFDVFRFSISNTNAGWRCSSTGTAPSGIELSHATASTSTITLPAMPGKAKDEEGIWDTLKSVLAAGKSAKADKAGAADPSTKTALDTASVRRLLRLVRPEFSTLGGAVATLGITTGISLLFPYVIGQVLDVAVLDSASATVQALQAQVQAGIAGNVAEAVADAAAVPEATPASKGGLFKGWDIGTLSGGLLALFGVQSGLIVVRSALLTTAGERIAATVRKDLFRAILSQDTAWFDTQRTGDLINRLSSDTTVLQKALTSNISNGLRSAFMTVGGVGMLVYLSPSLAALSLCLIPPVAVAGVTYGRYVAGQQKRVQELLGGTMQVAEEAVGAHRTVRQFVGEPREDARFRVAVDDSYTLARRIGIVAAYFDGGVHMAANVGLVAVLWYGGGLIASGAMTAGDLTAFLMYSLYTGFNVGNLSSTYTELKRAAGAATRVFDVVDRVPGMPLAGQGVRTGQDTESVQAAEGVGVEPAYWLRGPGSGAALQHSASTSAVRGEVVFESVRFAYPTRPDAPILDACTLTLAPGTITALVGASGSGKSTVGALLTRLYDPAAGRVLLDGADIRHLDPAWLRRTIGVVSQEPILFATTVGDNIRYGRPDASDEEVEAAARQSNAHDFIAAFPAGYGTPVGERGVQLSGGQKQRIAIARALLKDPPILILDEATSALDAESEGAVTAALSKAVSGRTVLTIAHRLSTMRASNCVAVMAGGRIVETGTFEALAENPNSAFRQLVDKQLIK